MADRVEMAVCEACGRVFHPASMRGPFCISCSLKHVAPKKGETPLGFKKVTCLCCGNMFIAPRASTTDYCWECSDRRQRAALEAFQRWYDEVRSYVYHSVKLATAVDKMRAALAAPARNCDRMPDIDKLTMCDLAKSPCKSTLECASREELLALVRWLLVPATEQAGERR